MRLEEYWGVGPKTRAVLVEALGEEAAIAAIEGADVHALTEAGLSSGRATRILRHANGGEGLDALATRDAHAVYRAILDLAREYAVTRRAADRIRVLTPLADRSAIEERLDDVDAAMETWATLSTADREAVLSVFGEFESVTGGELAAVEAARGLREAGLTHGVFAPLDALDGDALADAATALRGLDEDGVAEGVDDRLDAAREQLTTVRRLERDPATVVEDVRSGGVQATDDFRDVVVEHLADEAGVDREHIRDSMPEDAADATDFVASTLRDLVATFEETVSEREDDLQTDLEADLAAARSAVDTAVDVVSDIALSISLARFAHDFELTRPEFVDGPTLAVENARNLGLAAGEESVQPITYGVGDHDLEAPTERVAVLTGANSGGKTTLLETLCQVAVLARMGLPVPADRAQVSDDLRVVFHRRHASFNAGVLESTLQSIVPPLTADGRPLMLVDEFEAITEPGSAADLLHGLVTLTVDGVAGDATEGQAVGAFVTHLAEDLEPLPTDARVDGISAQGLDADLELQVDYQPRFHQVGRSTPEFIVSRLLADATDRRARAGFETLAAAIGEDAVQQTLADARWTE
ncbi:MAG: DNA mismatch repair protein [Halobacteriaceae archaeon]